MWKIVRLMAFVLLLSQISWAKTDKQFGVGLAYGSFGGGLNAKMRMQQDAALVLGFNYDSHRYYDDRYNRYDDDGDWALHVDYIVKHYYNVIRVPKGKMPLYLGLGVGIVEDGWRRDYWDNDEEMGLAGRIPLGIAYECPPGVPLDFFLEAVPTLWLIPGMNVDFDLGLGLRFWF
jgi:hypothetical protein